MDSPRRVGLSVRPRTRRLRPDARRTGNAGLLLAAHLAARNPRCSFASWNNPLLHRLLHFLLERHLVAHHVDTDNPGRIAFLHQLHVQLKVLWIIVHRISREINSFHQQGILEIGIELKLRAHILENQRR